MLKLIISIFVCLGVIMTPLCAISIGAADIPLTDVIQAISNSIWNDGSSISNTDRIIWELRVPRVLLAFIAGCGLALSGYILQTVTRNPLADPYLFGISSGASLGAVSAMTITASFSAASVIPAISLPVGAFIGASLSVLLVLLLSRGALYSQIERMLLSGVAISFLFGALTSLVLYFSTPQAITALLFWNLGSFAGATWQDLPLPAVVLIFALLIVFVKKRHIVTLLSGDETAHTLGVSVTRLRVSMLLLCSLITAITVAYCGGVGFVGLMVPHIVKRLLPQRHPLVLTALVGGVFMVWVDVLARSLLPNQELPVGIFTATIGSLFFVFVMRR